MLLVWLASATRRMFVAGKQGEKAEVRCVCVCVCDETDMRSRPLQLWPRSVRWHCSGLRRMQRTGGGYRLRLLGMRRVAASRRPVISLPFCCRRML